MKVWYRNRLSETTTLTCSNTTESPSALYHPFRGNNISFTANNTVITAQWPQPINADSIIITDCEALNIQAQLYNGSTLLQTFNFTPRSEPITVVMFNPLNITRCVLTVTNLPTGNFTIGKLYIGERYDMPFFSWGSFENGLNIPAGNSRTYGGQVYGSKQPTYDDMSASWKKISNTDMQRIRLYASTVQKTTPHFIAPYETDEVRPMYCVLSSIGKAKKYSDGRGGFEWNTSLSWEEAN